VGVAQEEGEMTDGGDGETRKRGVESETVDEGRKPGLLEFGRLPAVGGTEIGQGGVDDRKPGGRERKTSLLSRLERRG